MTFIRYRKRRPSDRKLPTMTEKIKNVSVQISKPLLEAIDLIVKHSDAHSRNEVIEVAISYWLDSFNKTIEALSKKGEISKVINDDHRPNLKRTKKSYLFGAGKRMLSVLRPSNILERDVSDEN